MIKWLCAKLAECFNAHLSEEEEEFKEAVLEAREAALQFNRCLRRLEKFKGATVYVHYQRYGTEDFVGVRSLSISKIEATLTKYKRV